MDDMFNQQQLQADCDDASDDDIGKGGGNDSGSDSDCKRRGLLDFPGE